MTVPTQNQCDCGEINSEMPKSNEKVSIRISKWKCVYLTKHYLYFKVIKWNYFSIFYYILCVQIDLEVDAP